MAEPSKKPADNVPVPAGAAKPEGEGAKGAPKPPLVTAAGAPKPASATAGPAAKAAVSDEGIDRRTLLVMGPVAIPWIAAAWATFGGALALAGGALTRFLFPNVLFEPPSSFKAGFPEDYASGKVDERWKNGFGVWLVRTPDDLGRGPGFYALSTVCTHLGCTPNWLEAEAKFKCPCHGSGFRKNGVNFEGPAPRPLERYRIVWADDGQILVDKSKKYQEEKGQWTDSESYLKYA